MTKQEIKDVVLKVFEGHCYYDGYEKAVNYWLQDESEKFEYFNVGSEETDCPNGCRLAVNNNKLQWEYNPLLENNLGTCRIRISFFINKINSEEEKVEYPENNWTFSTDIRVYDLSDFHKYYIEILPVWRNDIQKSRRPRGYYPELPSDDPQWILNLAGTFYEDRFNPYQILVDSTYSENNIDKVAPVIKKWCVEFFGDEWQKKVTYCGK